MVASIIVTRIEDMHLEELTDFYELTTSYLGSNEEWIMMLYRKMRLRWCE